MTPRIERGSRLLALAGRDIVTFRALASHPEVDTSATGFFAQQVVEKCLKAVAEYHGIVFRRTQDVDELVKRARPKVRAILMLAIPIQGSQS